MDCAIFQLYATRHSLESEYARSDPLDPAVHQEDRRNTVQAIADRQDEARAQRGLALARHWDQLV
jgi:hypothetical protein